LFGHLTDAGEGNRLLPEFRPDERRAVARLLAHLVRTRWRLADEAGCAARLKEAGRLWSAESGAAGPARGRHRKRHGA
jgi:hypothetical protein